MLIGIMAGIVIALIALSLFSRPKSKMDFSPITNWGEYIKTISVVKRQTNKVSRKEKELIYQSADDASWREQEQEPKKEVSVVKGIVPNECKKTLEYKQLTGDEQRQLWDALIQHEVNKSEKKEPPPIPEKAKKPVGRTTVVDANPYGIWHYERENNIISSCSKPEAGKPRGKKGNR